MVTGEPKAVAERLLEMKELAQADEIVVVTPSLDRDRRTGQLRGPRRRLAPRRLNACFPGAIAQHVLLDLSCRSLRQGLEVTCSGALKCASRPRTNW